MPRRLAETLDLLRCFAVHYCVADYRKLLINAPYNMIRARMERIAALRVGVEAYLDNEAVGEVSRDDARRLGRELEERGIIRTVHAPFMDLSPGGVDRDMRRISREKLKRA